MNTMKRGDTYDLEVQLTAKPGIDLVGATVVMNMRNAAGEVVISRGAVTIVDANLMQVKYVWQSGQTGVAGLYHIEFEALLANGKIYTFPSKGFVHLEIEGDIA